MNWDEDVFDLHIFHGCYDIMTLRLFIWENLCLSFNYDPTKMPPKYVRGERTGKGKDSFFE